MQGQNMLRKPTQLYNGTPLLWTPWGPGVSCTQWNPSIVDTLGTWCVLYTVEPLYCGHLGDLVCPVHSGTPLLWTPWGPGVSCTQWNPSIVDTLGTWCVLYTVEPLYCGHLGDLVKCPGVLISGVNSNLERIFGTWQSVLRGVL